MKCWCVHAARGGAMVTPLSSPFAPTTTILRSPLRHRALLLPLPPRAASPGEDAREATGDQGHPAATKTATADDAFEERILQIKSRVGPKKRGARKKKASRASSASASAVTLPPVLLWEPRSALSAPVEFGFTAYSERLNGALVPSLDPSLDLNPSRRGGSRVSASPAGASEAGGRRRTAPGPLISGGGAEAGGWCGEAQLSNGSVEAGGRRRAAPRAAAL